MDATTVKISWSCATTRKECSSVPRPTTSGEAPHPAVSPEKTTSCCGAVDDARSASSTSSSLTRARFLRMVALMHPQSSWVSKWQRLRKIHENFRT
eukprot:scaffold3144_cov260-Pinguiococcus_pyrenoidosus.AAC.5